MQKSAKDENHLEKKINFANGRFSPHTFHYQKVLFFNFDKLPPIVHRDVVAETRNLHAQSF